MSTAPHHCETNHLGDHAMTVIDYSEHIRLPTSFLIDEAKRDFYNGCVRLDGIVIHLIDSCCRALVAQVPNAAQKRVGEHEPKVAFTFPQLFSYVFVLLR